MLRCVFTTTSFAVQPKGVGDANSETYQCPRTPCVFIASNRKLECWSVIRSDLRQFDPGGLQESLHKRLTR